MIYHSKNPTLAYDYYEKSINLNDSIGAGFTPEKHKLDYFSKSSPAYKVIIPLCIELGKTKEVFNFLERSKSKTFLEMLAGSEIQPTVRMTPKLRTLLAEGAKQLEELREVQMAT